MPASARLVLTLFLTLTLSACGGSRIKDGPGAERTPDTQDAIPRQEPRSRYGNGPTYEVFGKQYRVMPTANGYQERGVASWYGKKFHGNLTSNREVYDMYAMTAAHKSLPLPTYVRVRNLSNNRTVVVRVNDRGPFVGNRIIDLSYAAAQKLDMVRDGTALVEVTVVSADDAAAVPTTTQPQPAAPPPAAPPATPVVNDTAPSPAPHTDRSYLQVGAFGDRINAERRVELLQDRGIGKVSLQQEQRHGGSIFRVRIGPITDVEQHDALIEALASIGISDPYLISE